MICGRGNLYQYLPWARLCELPWQPLREYGRIQPGKCVAAERKGNRDYRRPVSTHPAYIVAGNGQGRKYCCSAYGGPDGPGKGRTLEGRPQLRNGRRIPEGRPTVIGSLCSKQQPRPCGFRGMRRFLSWQGISRMGKLQYWRYLDTTVP